MKFDTTSKRTVPLISALFFLMLATVVKAQNPFSFTQYMNNLTPINPAYSLLDKAGSVNTTVRKQWVGVEGSPVSLLFNGNLPIESINGSTGLMVLDDKFAIERQTEVNLYFAKSIRLNDSHYLGVSLNAGVRNYIANYSALDPTVFDPVFANDVKETRPNIGFGAIYYTDWYYLGISLPQLTIHSLGTASIQNSTNYKNHYYFSGAVVINKDEDVKLKIASLLSYANGVPVIADISGILYFKETLGLGINYRTNKEMAGILTINLSPFQVGYSYQSGTSPQNLGNFNVSTHEIMLNYRFGKAATNFKVL